MSQKEKLVNRFRGKPTPRDITLNEFKKFGQLYGFELKDGAKHKCLIHGSNGMKFPFPVNGNVVDRIYVKEFLDMIDRLGLCE